MASIKRIIAEPAAPRAFPADREEPDVLELGGPIEAPPADPEPPRARWAVEGDAAVEASPAAAPPLAAPDQPPLMSPAAREASQRAMAALAGVAIDPAAPANSLDGLVREMLRPMLKDWLDANLPELVERVVAREVSRLGGR